MEVAQASKKMFFTKKEVMNHCNYQALAIGILNTCDQFLLHNNYSQKKIIIFKLCADTAEFIFNKLKKKPISIGIQCYNTYSILASGGRQAKKVASKLIQKCKKTDNVEIVKWIQSKHTPKG